MKMQKMDCTDGYHSSHLHERLPSGNVSLTILQTSDVHNHASRYGRPSTTPR